MSNINADDLRELKKLLDEGVITKEEFDMKKHEFLGETSENTSDKSNSNTASENITGKNNSGATSNNSSENPDEKCPTDRNSQKPDSQNGRIPEDDENTDEYDDSSRKSSKSTAIVIVAIVAIIAIFAMYMSNKNKQEQQAQNTQPVEQTQSADSSQDKTSPDDWKDFDEKSWADFKDINQKYSDLKDTVQESSNPEQEDAINQAKQYFTDKEKSLNYGQNDDQNKYLDGMKNICQKAENLCDDAANSDNESDLSKIKDKLAGIEEDISSVTKNRPDLLKKAGYTEEEIKDIIDRIKGDLGMNQ